MLIMNQTLQEQDQIYQSRLQTSMDEQHLNDHYQTMSLIQTNYASQFRLKDNQAKQSRIEGILKDLTAKLSRAEGEAQKNQQLSMLQQDMNDKFKSKPKSNQQQHKEMSQYYYMPPIDYAQRDVTHQDLYHSYDKYKQVLLKQKYRDPEQSLIQNQSVCHFQKDFHLESSFVQKNSTKLVQNESTFKP